MIVRNFDLNMLLRITGPYKDICPPEDFIKWYHMPKNLMFSEGENVGLATYEYPGVYGVHWYFTCRGRKAIDLAQRMVINLFENYGAETIRGVVKLSLKQSRWAARQVGMISHGVIIYPDGSENELFTATKQEFLTKMKENNNG